MKLIIWLIVMCAIVGLACGDSTPNSSSGDARPSGTRPEAGRPTGKSAGTGTLAENARSSNSLEGDFTLLTIVEEVEVPARAEGVLESLEVREGKLVEKGAVLARIDSAEASLSLERATIEHDIARTQAENDLKVLTARKVADVAHTDLRRALESKAIQKKAVSEAEIDRLQLAADKSDLEVAQAVHEQKTADLSARLKETEMKLAKQGVARRTIVSPISGMVVQIMHEEGEWVTAGHTVVRIIRLDRLRVQGDVSAKRLKENLLGRKVSWSSDLPEESGHEFSGDIVFVSPEVDPVNQSVRVWAEIDNSRLVLRPGLRGKVKIH
jgi:RND family efflux transporter MFP subunit